MRAAPMQRPHEYGENPPIDYRDLFNDEDAHLFDRELRIHQQGWEYDGDLRDEGEHDDDS